MEIERRAHHEETVRPRETFEFDARRTADFAARAVGADQIAPAMPFALAIAVDRDLDAGRVLAHVHDLAVEAQFEIGMAAHQIVENAGELRLLALQPKRMRRSVGDGREIELRQQAVRLRAILECRRFEPLRDHRFGGAERMQHVQRRRMERRGARFLGQIWSRLEHRDRNAAAGKMRCGGEPDGACAGNENSFGQIVTRPSRKYENVEST